MTLVVKVTWIGLIANLLLSLSKYLVGLWGNSQGLIADSIHSLSDVLSDIFLIIGAKYWNAPPDEDHPYGHKRIETFFTLLIGLSLAVVATLVCVDAFEKIFQPRDVKPLKMVVLIMCFVSFLVKEILYRWTFKKGKEANSLALKANAWHHRSDALSSIPILITSGIAYFSPQFVIADLIGALIVALLLLHAAFKISWPMVQELMDQGISTELIQRMESVAKEMEGIYSVHDIRGRFLGGTIQIDCHIEVDANITVQEGHDIGDRYMDKVKDIDENIEHVLVHVDPKE